MKIKKTVSLKGAVFQTGYAAGMAWGLLHHLDPNKEFVVTSVNDSKHGTGSLHYQGKAFDIRTKTLGESLRGRFFNVLKAELESQGFDVILESDHIHVEYQPKAGESFLRIVE